MRRTIGHPFGFTAHHFPARDFGTQVAECDREIEKQLRALQTHDGEPPEGKKKSRARNAPKFDLRTQLFKMCGVGDR